MQLIKTGNKGRSHETTLRNTPKIAPFFSDASSSIYKPKVPDITNCVLASGGVCSVVLLCLQIHCPPVASLTHSVISRSKWSWLGLWKLIRPFHLLQKSRPFDCCVCVCGCCSQAAAPPPAKVVGYEVSNWSEDMEFNPSD